jgi:Cu/Ag efflux pump CusA
MDRTVQQAVIEGATLRFRPVMMTATVAMLGLIPFLFSDADRVPKCSVRWLLW